MYFFTADTGLCEASSNSSTSARSFFELPLLPAHRTLLLDLLRVQPLQNAVHVETVGALTPDQWAVIPRHFTYNRD